MMRVLLADDHPLIVEATRAVLESSGDIEVVGAAYSGAEVLPLIGQTNPDLVLLDLRMPLMDGLTCLELIRRRYPRVLVVMMSASADPEHIQGALRRGASAFIVKSIDPRDIGAALRQAMNGSVYNAIGMVELDPASAGRAQGLTERELEILTGVASGRSNQAIAKELWVTEQTVKFHLTNIYRKLGVTNRTAAARSAYQYGLVESPLAAAAPA